MCVYHIRYFASPFLPPSSPSLKVCHSATLDSCLQCCFLLWSDYYISLNGQRVITVVVMWTLIYNGTDQKLCISEFTTSYITSKRCGHCMVLPSTAVRCPAVFFAPFRRFCSSSTTSMASSSLLPSLSEVFC